MPSRQLLPLALAYHGVGDRPARQDPHRLFVSEHDLRRHVAALRGWGYELVTFGRLLELEAEGRAGGHAALTFDDGLEDNLHRLVPLLRELAATATVFVATGWMGQEHPDAPGARLMTEAEVRRLHASGVVEVGGHTHSHADLGEADHALALRELTEARERLEAVVDAPVTVAAYPYGRASEAARRACRDAGYVGGCRACGHRVDGAFDPFDYPRQDMGNASTVLGLRLKRHARYEHWMRSPTLRLARRVRYRLRR